MAPSLPPPPLVVGTSRPAGLARLAAIGAADRGADIIEARLDLALPDPQGSVPGTPPTLPPDVRPYLGYCRQLEQSGTPVLATIRLVGDGGRWRGDSDRLELFEEALAVASWVDVEVESAIAAAVVSRARQRGRSVIISHHDFGGTPELPALEALVDRARALGGDVVKVATRVDSLADHDTLLELLRRRRQHQALAVVAMGAWGTALRSYLPCVGSRLTYGFLDEAVAPGQIAAPALIDRLLTDCPSYAARRRPPRGAP